MPADSTPPARRMSRDAALDVLARRPTDQVVVSTMTALRPWAARSSGDRDLLNMGFMGGASTYGLGVALARPDVAVWVLDGDGSLLMQLGSLATIAHAAPANFLHVVLHNGVYETSGAQVIPGAGRISFAGMAREAGYADTVRFDDVEAFDAQLDEIPELGRSNAGGVDHGPVRLVLPARPAAPGAAHPGRRAQLASSAGRTDQT